MHELPLVFFTVFAQMAAGTVLITSIYALLSKKELTLNKVQHANWFAFFTMLIAIGLAFFHLGRPLRAMNVIFGLGRSPMSNEIFIFSSLVGITFASLILNRLNKTSKWDHSFLKIFLHKPIWTKLLSVLLILFSLFTFWAIVLVYQIQTVPTWNTPFTALQMSATFFILGGATCFMFGFKFSGFCSFTLGLIIVLVTKLSYIDFLNSLYPALSQAQYSFWIIQFSFLIIAFIMIIWLIIKSKLKWYTTGLILMLSLVAELSCRIAFYNVWKIPMS